MTRSVEARSRSHLPRLLVRAGATPSSRRTVLVSARLLGDDEAAVRTAGELAAGSDAEQLLVGIAPVALPDADPTELDAPWAGDGRDDQESPDQMTSERLSELRRLLRNRTCRQVLRHATVPVLVVPGEGSRP